MYDDRTEDEKYDEWLQAVNECWANGWKNVDRWVFISPSGSKHDLSAADLKKLDYIDKNQLFLI